MDEDRDRFSSQLKDLQQSLKQTRQGLREVDRRISQLKTEVGAMFEAILEFFKRREVVQFLDPLPAQGIDLEQLNQNIRNLCLGQTQEEILDRFLKQSAPYVDRALLFLEKDGRYTPWKSMGFELRHVEGVVAFEPDDPIVRSAQQQRILYRADGIEDVFGWLTQAGERPATCVCVPMVFGDGRVPLVLYADSDRAISINSLELLSHLTVLVLKNHYLQYLIETGAQAGQTTAEDPPVNRSQLVDREASPPENRPLGNGPATQLKEASHKERSVRMVETSGAQPEKTSLGETGAEPGQDGELGLEEPPKQSETQGLTIVPFEKAAAGESSPATTRADAKEMTAGPVPDQLKEGAPGEKPAADQLRKCAVEAKQLARLLVAEIRLHNPDQLHRGRRFSDLYQRLRTDVDRGREIYSKTVDPLLGSERDYFHEELVKALALGDESILGDDYPGFEPNPKPVETTS